LSTFGGVDDAALPPDYVGSCLTNTIAGSRGFLLVEVLARQGGHVVGLRLEPGHLEALDPNVGLWALDNPTEVRVWWETCLSGIQEVLGAGITMVRLYSLAAPA
jgi:hypothetical protein